MEQLRLKEKQLRDAPGSNEPDITNRKVSADDAQAQRRHIIDFFTSAAVAYANAAKEAIDQWNATLDATIVNSTSKPDFTKAFARPVGLDKSTLSNIDGLCK